MCKADVRKGLKDGLAMRLPLSEPREIYKDNLETDNRSNIGSEFNFEIDLPGKRDRSTIYRLNLIKLYRRKPELANLVMENSSEGIDSEILYSVKLFMDIDFQGILRESQLYFKLPPDRSSYLRMINAKKKEGFPPDPGTIVLRQKDINLITGKPFRIKTCCSSQMLINTLREDTVYLLDLQEFEPGDASRDLSFVKKGKFCRKEQRGIVGQQIDFVLKCLSRVGSEVEPTKGEACLKRIMSSFLVLREGDNRNRWRDGQVCPDVGQGIMVPWARRPGRREKKETREKRGGREEPGLGWRKEKSPALDGESMRGEPWLERTGRER
ncbi:uncharacterized protein TNCV_1307071 [Trichonephila clavipes]|nr:uncharacterized protein TNCV_1307071 [Trichonephila clavipes]